MTAYLSSECLNSFHFCVTHLHCTHFASGTCADCVLHCVRAEASFFIGVTFAYTLQEPGAAPAPVKPPPTEDDALDDSKFDEFMGSDAGAFASFGEYDQVYAVCCCCCCYSCSCMCLSCHWN